MHREERRAHRAAQVVAPAAGLQVLPTTPIDPGSLQARVDVVASGICGADTGTVRSAEPPAGLPVTPGHEVAGVIADLGPEVTGYTVGERVTVGWLGGSCGTCPACRRGDPVHCPRRQVPGIAYPGGWSTTITVPAAALARIPDGLTMTEAAPFGCAGVTAFNAVRQAGVTAGGRVAVVGIGGVGHMAVQFASAMGYETIAVARGTDKKAWVERLGAHRFVDATVEWPGAALDSLGGADLIVSTASSTALLEELVDGLAPRGQLVVVGLDGASTKLSPARLVMHGRSIVGHLTGSPAETELAMRFAVATWVRPRVEEVPLDDVTDALVRQQSGRARFRMVLTTDRSSVAQQVPSDRTLR
ncbi:MAG: alcohol dehydrogenase [Pseudonocardia sp. SCN 72-86]|nr:MAG: alcohol dehydrogenase [Pseudonocardia sp. SCN 72-86]